MKNLFLLTTLTLLFCVHADADVITSVETLDGTTGLPIPGSGDMDFGVSSAISSSAGSTLGSFYSGSASASHTSFTDGFQTFNSFQFKLFTQTINPNGVGGGPEAFEIGSTASWSDTITGVTGDIVILPVDLRLVFQVHGFIDITDPNAGANTVATEFSANANDGDGGSSFAIVSATNTDGGANEYMNVSVLNFATPAANEFTATVIIPVKRDFQFNVDFRLLSVLGGDGSAEGDLLSTVNLVAVTDVGGMNSFQNVLFGDTSTAFSSASAVPEPSSAVLLGLCASGLLIWRRRRSHCSSKN